MWIRFRNVCLRAFCAFATVVMLLPIGRSAGEAYDVRDPDACVLHFPVLSDCHIEGNNYARYTVFVCALQDVEHNRSGNDAVVFLGDNTMNGNPGEHILFHGAVAALLKNEKILPVLGNHDVGNGQGDYEKLQARWYTYLSAFYGKTLGHPYYYEVIDGAYFIVLGMEGHESNWMPISNAQFTWLEDVLRQAGESGMPTFVFSHHPAYCAIDENGDRTDRLSDMLAEYNEDHDLFSFVGHTHRAMSLSGSFRTYDGYPEIYLPCLTTLTGEKDDTPHEGTGVGLEVEVYENEVLIRARDFYRSVWKTDSDGETMCERTYKLKYPVADPVAAP